MSKPVYVLSAAEDIPNIALGSNENSNISFHKLPLHAQLQSLEVKLSVILI